MKIKFYTHPTGVCCDKCGTFIKNVNEITTERGVYNIGTECFKQLYENSSFSETGKKMLKTDLNKAKKLIKEAKAIRTGEIYKYKKYENVVNSINSLLGNKGCETKEKSEETWANILEARANKIFEKINLRFRKVN